MTKLKFKTWSHFRITEGSKNRSMGVYNRVENGNLDKMVETVFYFIFINKYKGQEFSIKWLPAWSVLIKIKMKGIKYKGLLGKKDHQKTQR